MVYFKKNLDILVEFTEILVWQINYCKKVDLHRYNEKKKILTKMDCFNKIMK
jgi:hypothetical protein